MLSITVKKESELAKTRIGQEKCNLCISSNNSYYWWDAVNWPGLKVVQPQDTEGTGGREDQSQSVGQDKESRRHFLFLLDFLKNKAFTRNGWSYLLSSDIIRTEWYVTYTKSFVHWWCSLLMAFVRQPSTNYRLDTLKCHNMTAIHKSSRRKKEKWKGSTFPKPYSISYKFKIVVLIKILCCIFRENTAACHSCTSGHGPQSSWRLLQNNIWMPHEKGPVNSAAI